MNKFWVIAINKQRNPFWYTLQ